MASRITASGSIDTERSLTSAALSGAAALMHFVVAPGHFEDWAVYYVLFMGAAVLQVAYAVLVWQRPTRTLLYAGAALNVGIAVVWLCSRTLGLPFGPDAGDAEALGAPDIVTTLCELLAAGLALRPGPGPSPAAVRVAAIALVVTVLLLIPDAGAPH